MIFIVDDLYKNDRWVIDSKIKQKIKCRDLDCVAATR